MSKTKIQWTDETWNVTTGCTRVSAGCDNCYAVKMTKRLAQIGHTEEKYGGLVNEGKDHFNGKIKLHPEVLKEPLHWQKPRRVFVNSMSDLFHPSVPFDFIATVFGVMSEAERHTFQILTKRPERIVKFFEWVEENWQSRLPEEDKLNTNAFMEHAHKYGIYGDEHYEASCSFPKSIPLPNIWIGTSVENQEAADDRIPHLLECPAAIRFLSCEPLLGPVSLNVKIPGHKRDECASWLEYGCTESRIDWVIAGGESGPNARPMHPDWVRGLRDQCQEGNVPFFFKQWGAWKPTEHDNPEYFQKSYSGYLAPDGGELPSGKNGEVLGPEELEEIGCYHITKVGKSEAGRQIDGKEWNQFPEVE